MAVRATRAWWLVHVFEVRFGMQASLWCRVSSSSSSRMLYRWFQSSFIKPYKTIVIRTNNPKTRTRSYEVNFQHMVVKFFATWEFSGILITGHRKSHWEQWTCHIANDWTVADFLMRIEREIIDTHMRKWMTDHVMSTKPKPWQLHGAAASHSSWPKGGSCSIPATFHVTMYVFDPLRSPLREKWHKKQGINHSSMQIPNAIHPLRNP